MYKAMLLVLCAVLLVVASVMGTLAYLQMTTGTVQNTFTVGNVTIELKEYEIDANGEKTSVEVTASNGLVQVNGIKMVPSRVIQKNPFITIGDTSEECYLYVRVTEIDEKDYLTINWTSGDWILSDNEEYYYYKTTVGGNTGINRVDVFTSVTCNNAITVYDPLAAPIIKITAYAVQKEGFNNPQTAWEQSGVDAPV